MGPRGIQVVPNQKRLDRENRQEQTQYWVDRILSKMEKTFAEKKLNGIIEDSLKNSIFGTFGENYAKHKHRKALSQGQ